VKGRDVDMEKDIRDLIRSPRETLGGFVFLPRLIDKVRCYAMGQLPAAYHENLLKEGRTFDGRFMSFVGVSPEELRKAVLASKTDAEVLSWVLKNGHPKTEKEIMQWILEIRNDRPDKERSLARERSYPEVAKKWDVSRLSPFDLIDLDEGRMEEPVDL
jgi:hypothetical protein